MARKKMTDKEKQNWESLYNYVKSLMGYDENQALSKNMVLRLKGLLTNKFMENKNVTSTANYSYETILNAFKYSLIDIQRALRNGSYKDEMHRFNTMLKIVERNINTVYMKMKSLEKSTEEIKSVDMTHATEYVNTFKSKDKKTNNRLDELW